MLRTRPTIAVLLCAMAMAVSPRIARAQMMGGGGHMHAMRELMAWMRGADIKAAPSVTKPQFSAELRASGKLLYGEHCAICHGADGDGNGRRASELSPRPRDFTKGVYEFRSTRSGALPTDDDVWKVISEGLHGTAMVPWVSLSEQDRWALVAYVEGFSSRFDSEARVAAIAVPPAPAETPDLIAKGRTLFADAGCVECHGAKGRGDGPSTPSLKDAAGRPIRPLDFGAGIFRRGASIEDIYLTLETGLNGTPMPSYADSLTPEQAWAVAAYVRSLIGASADAKAEADTRRQESLGMQIDMPGMAAMPMGGMMMH